MIKKTDPFTKTPGIAGKAYIDNGVADEIINNFRDKESAKYIYKIIGLRGSGKSVEYRKVITTLKEKNDWKVYPISAETDDAVKTLISKLSMEKFIDSKKTTTSVSSNTTMGGDIKIVNGSETVTVSKDISDNAEYYSDEATLSYMVSLANKKKYKVLVGIDDIAKTPAMVKLLSIIDSMIMEGLQLYLVVTGLAENIEEFTSEKTLSFFKRSDAIEVKPLSKYDIFHMYKKLLEVDDTKAKELEELTGGYAYAYQVLGSLYYKKSDDETIEDLIPEYERTLFKDSYDLVWKKQLSRGEKEFIRCICKAKDGKVSEILKLMDKPGNYSSMRERLIAKHIIDGDERGYIKLRLPRFGRFIEIWGN